MANEIHQSEVNEACETLKSQGKSITIAHVRSILGKGTHSQLVDAVLRYKEDPKGAIRYAEKETSAVSENPPTKATKPRKKKASTKKPNLIDQLKSFTKSNDLSIPESSLIEIAQLSDQHFQQSVDRLKKKHNKAVQTLKIQIDQLETRLYAANDQLTKKSAIIEHLNQQQLMLTRQDVPRHSFKTNSSAKTQAEVQAISQKVSKGPTVDEQLRPIHSARVAAYDFSTGNIVLKANDFNGPLLKILRLNQKEVISANVHYEYKTRFYHLSNCTQETITFLNDYHFAFSDALSSQVNKIFNH